MRDLIYYPGFEVSDQNWLKFALLYVDKLRPVIPHAGDVRTSDYWRRLQNETDLVVPYRPVPPDGERVTRETLELLDKIHANPDRYTDIFGNHDYVTDWRLAAKRRSTLFHEKYSQAWEDYCLFHKFGQKSERGLEVASDLVAIYMTIFASVVSEVMGVSSITDNRHLDRLTALHEIGPDHIQSQVNLAQGVISLSLPEDLSKIKLKTLIRLRNTAEFQETQRAFHVSLAAFLERYEGKGTPQKFIDELGTALTDFGGVIKTITGDLVLIGLGVWVMIADAAFSLPNLASEITGATLFAAGASSAIRETRKNTYDARKTRKYLAALDGLV